MNMPDGWRIGKNIKIYFIFLPNLLDPFALAYSVQELKWKNLIF